MRRFFVILPGLWLLALLVAPALHAQTDDFLPVEQAFSYGIQANEDATLAVSWQIEPGYYLYRHRLEVKGEPGPVADVTLPPGESYTDEFFGASQIYHDRVTAVVDPVGAKRLRLSWQGCAEAGLCYAPQQATVNVSEYMAAAPASNAGQSGGAAAALTNWGSDQAVAARLAEANSSWVLLTFFGLGILLAFTPCVLPMVPILSSLIVGTGARRGRGFVLSSVYVLAMAAVYAALGVAAAAAGSNVQAALMTPWIIVPMVVTFVVLALAMFGAFELQLPAGVRHSLDRVSNSQQGGSLVGATTTGALSALLVGPCLTAPLTGALIFIANTGNAVLGGLALFLYGLGMGAPLVVAGTLGAHFLPRPGPWMNAVKVVFGFLMLGTAVWFAGRILPQTWMVALWGVWLVAMAVTLFHFARRATGTPLPVASVGMAASLLLGLWGGLIVVGAAAGAQDPLRPFSVLTLANAQATGGGADEFMERFGPAADRQASIAKVDAWRTGRAVDPSRLLRCLTGHYNVYGPPTLLLIGLDGRERRAARIVGELDAEAFRKHLRKARKAN